MLDLPNGIGPTNFQRVGAEIIIDVNLGHIFAVTHICGYPPVPVRIPDSNQVIPENTILDIDPFFGFNFLSII
jgi:hypothetical protein